MIELTSANEIAFIGLSTERVWKLATTIDRINEELNGRQSWSWFFGTSF
jgi:hypothetical protein